MKNNEQVYDDTIFHYDTRSTIFITCLGSLIVFNLYKRSEPNKAILFNNCFKPGAGILAFKEAEEYLMKIECFSSCGNMNTLNRFPLNNDIKFKQLFGLDLNRMDMKKKE